MSEDTTKAQDAHPEDDDLNRFEHEGGLALVSGDSQDTPPVTARLNDFVIGGDPALDPSTHPTFYTTPTLVPLPDNAPIDNAPALVEDPKAVTVPAETWLEPADFVTFYRNPDTGNLNIALITGMTTVGDEPVFSIAVFFPHHYEQFGGVKVHKTEPGCITG